MKVTIRGVNPKLWEAVQVEVERSRFHPPQTTSGEIVNEGLIARAELKRLNEEAKRKD